MNNLNININATGRQFLLDNSLSIGLAFCDDSDGKHAVVCASFKPFGDVNALVFSDTWAAYAMQATPDFWKVITFDAQATILFGNLYFFNNVGFNGSLPTGMPQMAGISNQRNTGDSETLSCGFARQLTINNTTNYYAVNVYALPYNQSVYFQPGTKLLIFLSAGLAGNMIVPPGILASQKSSARGESSVTIGSFLEIELADTTTITFDNGTNSFLKSQ